MKRILELKPEAFLFDLDGTLIDSEMLWSRAIVDWMAAYGVKAEVNATAALVFGHSWFDIHTALLERYPALPQRTAQENALELRVHYNRVATNLQDIIIPAAVAVYRRAAEIAPCAIVSGSPHNDVAAAARLCGIDGQTAFVLGMEDYIHGKPAPDGYLLAAQRLNVDPARCIVFEDSTAGVQSGLAAGMKVIGIDRNSVVRQDFTGCHLTVHDLSELTRR